MAFHMACPITCQKICYCTLGFPGPLQSYQGKREFLDDVDRLEVLISNPELLAAGGQETVEVLVPRISISMRDYTTSSKKSHGGVGDADDDRDDRFSTQTKQMAMRKKAATLASLAAEDYSRKLEHGDFTGAYPEADLMRPGKHKGTHLPFEEAIKRNALLEETGSLLPKTICRICFYGEDEGTKKSARMLSCKSCNKKYHRSCLKRYAENRDLFNWASWICPSCVSCEVCKRFGDPNKLMFCKRCDAARHSYCQHPPHKNVTPGPYLCPEHTWCHSCRSTVPGSGLSTRWFLGYTSCDACGRLFIKGKYCPICLKVYRDSESTPMVCCDACERWVHCDCDGISEEKYQQFQADGNLYYRCAACRGDCYQVKDLDDAVQELWRRRDEMEQEQMTNLRADAGLPSQQELIHLCPSSDDNEEFLSIEPKDELTKHSKAISKGVAERTFKSGKDQMMKHKEYGKKASKNILLNKKIVKKKGFQVHPNGKSGALNNSFHIFQSEMKVEENSTPSQDQNSLVYENIEEEWSQKSDGNKFYSPPKTASSVKDGISAEGDDTIFKSNIVESGLLSGKKNAKVHKSKNSSKSSHSQMHEKVDTQTEKFVSKSESSKRTKIVLHLPARDKRNKETGKSSHRPGSEARRSQREESSAGSQGVLPIHSSKNHSDNKRQHLSKHQDTDSSWGKLKKSFKVQKVGSDEGDKLTSSGMGKYMAKDEYGSSDFLQEAEVNLPSNASSVTYKIQRNKVGSFEGLPANVSQDEDSSELTRKQLILSNLGGQTGNHGNETSGIVDNLSYKRSLKVKFKKPSFDKTSWVQRRDEDEGLKSAQMFPDDFDGIIAGSAASDFNHLSDWAGRFLVLTGTDSSNPRFLTYNQWVTVHNAVLAQCDEALDGVADGIIEDSTICNFNATVLLAEGLTSTQVTTVNNVFSQLYDQKGLLIYPRLSPGAELTSAAYGVVTGSPQGTSVDWFRYGVWNNASWDPTTLSQKDYTKADQLDVQHGNISTFNGNLNPFKSAGAKLLMYHGLADPVIAGEQSQRYYLHVANEMGLDNTGLDEFLRFFRISGGSHCNTGGAGAWAFGQSNQTRDAGDSVIDKIVDWVENGVAPVTLNGTKWYNDDPAQGVAFERPHCRFPYRTTYVSGNPNITASWTCKYIDNWQNCGPGSTPRLCGSATNSNAFT